MVAIDDYTYTTEDIVMQIDHVSLSFVDEEGNEKPVLRDVHTEIRNIVRPGMQQGQVVALLGPSGIGKTQLFRIMAGLHTGGKREGRVLLGSEGTATRPGLVGVVAQSSPLFRHRTVLGNLLVAAQHLGLTPKQAQDSAQQLLELFELQPHAEKYPSQLSGGQRQRVALAQQLIGQKYFLLMDEPFASLDPLMTDRAIAMIQKANCLDEHNTTIVVTHDISAAISVADMLWVLGRDRDDAGNVIPGAYIKKTYDLAAMGLAWRPDIRKDARFAPLSNELRDLFKTL